MPNWCDNKLKVTGEEKELKKFHKKTKGQEFFKKNFPLPKDLIGTSSPSKKKNKVFQIKYGTDNWYDWQVKNWGTKWDVTLELEDENERERVYRFQSAWSPPVQGIGEVSKKFPKLLFFLDYEEQGNAFRGMARIENGTIDDKTFDM